jgi:transaldolase
MGQFYTKQLGRYGQSLWYDNISRSFIRRGHLAKLIREDNLGGVTSNPTIFMKAIAEGKDYDEDIRRLGKGGKAPEEVVHALMVGDIREAADVLRNVYDVTEGKDGYFSLECIPRLAYETQATIDEARGLFKEVDRPNVMIKVPGTPQGAAAVKDLITRGININITLLFSPEQYRRVAEAYIEALGERRQAEQGLHDVHSVASFFLSRIDTAVDKRLDDLLAAAPAPGKADIAVLRGETAVAVAKVTYSIFRQLFFTEPFTHLEEQGATIQRPLWASTGTKDPAYSDVKYVEALIGPHTVNTVPQATLDAFRDHGLAAETITANIEEAPGRLEKVRALGIDLDQILEQLQVDGVKAFIESYDALVNAVKRKMA